MTHATSQGARSLFVIDHDFGALGTVMYLLHRQPVSAQTTLLLPPRAYDLNKARLPMASRPYRSLQDILDVVETESPDVVFLFSGYLLAAQGLLTLRDLRSLIGALRRRGCRVATSDPYLGTHFHIADAGIPARGLAARLARFYGRQKVKRHVRRLADILADVTHVYPVPMDPPRAGSAKRAFFFNPLYIRSDQELRENTATVVGLSGAAAGGPRWLFVLARFDLEFQEETFGKQGFVDRVAGKMREALDAGRQPMFIGPAAITEVLSRRFPPGSGVGLLPTCSFEEFQERMLDAEIAFYWNVLSTSAFFRLWNGLPAFFFDQGHNARVMKPLREAALKHYYLADRPIYLDIDKPLDAAGLARVGPRFSQSAHEARMRLAGLPTPPEMISAIIEAG